MKVFIACWFDRHIDPLIEPFSTYKEAVVQLEEWMKMREYEYVRTWEDADWDEDTAKEFKWIFSVGLEAYVTAKIDDGPHGYVLLREIR